MITGLTSAIHVSNLTVTAENSGSRKVLLSGIFSDMPSGSFVSVIGASGCGKSTTRHYDIVKQSSETYIAPYDGCLYVLAIHILAELLIAWFFVGRTKSA